jgi:hypothetical protein
MKLYTCDLKPISKALNELIKTIRPLPINISQMKEAATDFGDLEGIVRVQSLRNDYLDDLYKEICALDSSKVGLEKIEVAKNGIVRFGEFVIGIESQLLKKLSVKG